MILSDWPKSEIGVLEAKDGARRWVVNQASASAKLQWVNGFTNWSTMYAASMFCVLDCALQKGSGTVAMALATWAYQLLQLLQGPILARVPILTPNADRNPPHI